MIYDCDCPKPKCSKCPPDNILVPPSRPECREPRPFCGRCEPLVFFRTQTIPADMGTSEEGQPYAPQNGAYKNMLVRYEADGVVVIYDSEKIWTRISDGNSVTSVNDKTGDVVLTTSDLENDSGYITEDYLQDLISAAVFGTTESTTIATSDWSTITGAGNYTYTTTITPTYTLTANTQVELLNNQPVLFSTYGFAIASADTTNNTVTIYSIGEPTDSVTLNINYKEVA